MPIDLYYIPGSVPCRAVLLTAEAVGVTLNLIKVDILQKEQFTPKFIEMNPQHTLPTINDHGFIIWESRAIMQYLQNQYGKDDSLYPKDPKKRAIVDQRLYFDLEILYHRCANYFYPVLFGHVKSYEPAKLELLNEAFRLFDTLLTKYEFAASNQLTLADLALVATVSTGDHLGYDLSPYKNVIEWYDKVKTTAPGYEEANGKNLRTIKPIAMNNCNNLRITMSV